MKLKLDKAWTAMLRKEIQETNAILSVVRARQTTTRSCIDAMIASGGGDPAKYDENWALEDVQEAGQTVTMLVLQEKPAGKPKLSAVV